MSDMKGVISQASDGLQNIVPLLMKAYVMCSTGMYNFQLLAVTREDGVFLMMVLHYIYTHTNESYLYNSTILTLNLGHTVISPTTYLGGFFRRWPFLFHW